jgi:hypothetical protein
MTLTFLQKSKDQEGNNSLTTQKNGVVERKNRSIVETIKSMVHDLDLPHACCTTIYILNKCPYRVLKDKTPVEAETNKVCSHKNYPKYLEYNIIIHVGIMYKNMNR